MTMNFEAYKKWVKGRVNLDNSLLKDHASAETILGAMGLAGEAGEVVDVLKKSIFHGRMYSKSQIEKLKQEMGDTLWYYALLCEQFDFTLDDIIADNIARLEIRDGEQGEKFAETRA